MARLLLRPKIERTTDQSVDDVRRLLERSLEETDRSIVGDVFSDHAELRIPPSDLHFWSPQLKLVFDDRDGVTRIHGRIGPQSNVWTLFLAGYAFCAILAFIGFMFGSSQWLIGQSPTGLWLTAASGVVAVIEYVAGLVGRRLGSDQTERLRSFIDDVAFSGERHSKS